MSELIDRIPGVDSMLGRIKDMRDTAEQFKARQKVTGRSGQLGYKVDSGNEWDYAGTVAYTNATYTDAVFRVIFTSDGTQKFPIAVPQLDVRVNGSATSNRLTLDPSAYYMYNDATIDLTAFKFGDQVEDYFTSETQIAWDIELFFIGKTGSGNMPVYIKVLVQSTCGGTFSVVRL